MDVYAVPIHCIQISHVRGGGLFNFLQSPLDAATHTIFKNNPVPVNVVLLSIAVVVGVALVMYTGWKARTIHREMLEDEAESAREVLMPDATTGAGYGTTD